MTFDEWWKQMKPECDEVKEHFQEAWRLAFADGYDKGVSAFHDAVKMEREACAEVCRKRAKAMRETIRTANPRASEHIMLRRDARLMEAAECAADIMERSNAKAQGGEPPCGEASPGAAGSAADGD